MLESSRLLCISDLFFTKDVSVRCCRSEIFSPILTPPATFQFQRRNLWSDCRPTHRRVDMTLYCCHHRAIPGSTRNYNGITAYNRPVVAQGVWQLELIGCNEITEAGLWACLTPRIVSLTLSDCINVADDAIGAVAQMLPALNDFTLQAYHVTDAALGFFSSRQSNSLSALRLQSCWELTNHGIVNIGKRNARHTRRAITVRFGRDSGTRRTNARIPVSPPSVTPPSYPITPPDPYNQLVSVFPRIRSSDLTRHLSFLSVTPQRAILPFSAVYITTHNSARYVRKISVFFFDYPFPGLE